MFHPAGFFCMAWIAVTATDQDVVRLETALFGRLADAIAIPAIASLGYTIA
jgi:hypothetical protein